MESGDKFVIVDLGDLSKTKFADTVITAQIVTSEGCSYLQLQTRSINTEMKLKSTDPPGTYILYDSEEKLVGIANEEYAIN
jgi:hypothetical protein